MGMSSESAVTSVAEPGGAERSRGDDVADRESTAGVELSPSPTTMELAMQYKMAILWSAFIGLGALNWGLDILVSDLLPLGSLGTDQHAVVQHFHCGASLPEGFWAPLWR